LKADIACGGLILILNIAPLFGQVILTEIMANPAGSETAIPGGDSNEYIELFNAGDDSVDLTGWSFTDGDDDDYLSTGDFQLSPLPIIDGVYNSMILPPEGFALILDPEYVDPANDQPFDWPENTLILTIQTTTDLGGYRLSTTDPVTLFDEFGTPVDSFPNPFDPGDGISAERTSIEGNSWLSCVASTGNTAGSRNSHWPFGNDLSLDSLTTPNNPAEESPVAIFAYVSNVGDNTSSSSTIRLYEHDDTSSSELISTESIPSLLPGEGHVIEFSADLAVGSYVLFCTLPNDDNQMNNDARFSLFVGPSGWPICVTEFMFMPITGESEWIEIHNWGDESVDLTGWQFGDEITLHDIPACTLEPGEFAVLIQDSSSFGDSLCPEALLLEPSGWAALNNTGDNVRLFDSAGLPRQILPYTSAQFGSCMDYGISAEALEAGSYQFVCSPAGRTPGCENSIWFITPGTANVYVEPNPFNPTKETTTIHLEFPSGGVEAYIYDRMGRRMATVAHPDRSVGLEFVWDGRDDCGEILPSGMYVLHARDADGYSAKKVIALEGGR